MLENIQQHIWLSDDVFDGLVSTATDAAAASLFLTGPRGFNFDSEEAVALNTVFFAGSDGPWRLRTPSCTRPEHLASASSRSTRNNPLLQVVSLLFQNRLDVSGADWSAKVNDGHALIYSRTCCRIATTKSGKAFARWKSCALGS